MTPRICTIDGCEKPVEHVGLGLCAAHHSKLRKYGDPLGTGSILPRGLTRAEYFERKVNRDGECHLWTGKIADNGYGHFTYRKNGVPTTVLAHRYAWETTIGPIPDGAYLDHVWPICPHKHCVRIEHLEPVTPGENTRRYLTARLPRQFCKKAGHEYTPENTCWTKKGWRVCRACRNEWARNHRQRASLPS